MQFWRVCFSGGLGTQWDGADSRSTIGSRTRHLDFGGFDSNRFSILGGGTGPSPRLRTWISEGSTQADSYFQGVEFPGPQGTSQKFGANDLRRYGWFPQQFPSERKLAPTSLDTRFLTLKWLLTRNLSELLGMSQTRHVPKPLPSYESRVEESSGRDPRASLCTSLFGNDYTKANDVQGLVWHKVLTSRRGATRFRLV